MNYVERAKKFLKQQVQGAALAAVPLAMALGAGEAQGATILPTSAATCVDLGGDFLFACSIATQAAPNGGTTFLPGTLQEAYGRFGYVIANSGGGARVEQSGILNESFSGSIVANYSFQLDYSDHLGSYGVSAPPADVPLTILQVGGNSYTAVITGTGTYSGSVTLSNVNLTAGLMTIVSFAIDSPDSTKNVEMNFPNSGFIMFTPVSDTPGVPEPGTMALVGIALAGAWRVRLRLVRRGN